MEDDITASVLVPRAYVKNLSEMDRVPTLKFVKNCEQRLFQRPDDAIHRGYDKQTESDFARPDNFFSNYEPLPAKTARGIDRGRHRFPPIHRSRCRRSSATWPQTGKPDYFVSSAHPRLVDGKPSKNPRYLQKRPDLVNPRGKLSRGNGRAPAPPRAARPAGADAGQCRFARTPQQSARTRHPLARVLQPDSLHGIAGIVHGIHLQHDRQIAFHDRRRFRRRADQRTVQRAAADHGPEQRARLVGADGLPRLRHRRRLCRPESAHGP